MYITGFFFANAQNIFNFNMKLTGVQTLQYHKFTTKVLGKKQWIKHQKTDMIPAVMIGGDGGGVSITSTNNAEGAGGGGTGT